MFVSKYFYLFPNFLSVPKYFQANLGWLTGLCLGLVIPIQWYTIVLCVPSLLFLGLAWRLPESPVWLMRSGQEAEARLTLEWLRGKKYDTLPEMEELRAVTGEKEAGAGAGGWRLQRTFLLPLALTSTVFMVQAVCGVELIFYYNGVIFQVTFSDPQ